MSAILTLGTGFLFGLYPSLHSTRPDLISSLKNQAGQPSGAKAAARFRITLATAQIALSMMLLVSAGLFAKSLVNVMRATLGLNPDHVVTFGVSPQLNGYKPEQIRQLAVRLTEELAALPGAASVTGGLVPVLAGSNWGPASPSRASMPAPTPTPTRATTRCSRAISPHWTSRCWPAVS